MPAKGRTTSISTLFHSSSDSRARLVASASHVDEVWTLVYDSNASLPKHDDLRVFGLHSESFAEFHVPGPRLASGSATVSDSNSPEVKVRARFPHSRRQGQRVAFKSESNKPGPAASAKETESSSGTTVAGQSKKKKQWHHRSSATHTAPVGKHVWRHARSFLVRFLLFGFLGGLVCSAPLWGEVLLRGPAARSAEGAGPEVKAPLQPSQPSTTGAIEPNLKNLVKIYQIPPRAEFGKNLPNFYQGSE